MNQLTRVFLVLLRLAIGWHFLVEGYEKVHSVSLGRTETNRPWTSEPYLREANGPVGGLIRQQVGDPDELALERLTVRPLEKRDDPEKTAPYTRMPVVLDQEWTEYFNRFLNHYKEVYEPLR